MPIHCATGCIPSALSLAFLAVLCVSSAQEHFTARNPDQDLLTRLVEITDLER
jgi:hypothetical protein